MPQPVEQRIHDTGFLQANADLTASQYRAVKITGDYQIGLCNAAGEPAYGILQDKPDVNQVANVRSLGISRAIAGAGGLTAGQKWQTAADGSLIPAASGDAAGGVVIMGAAAGSVAVVTVGFGAWPVLA